MNSLIKIIIIIFLTLCLIVFATLFFLKDDDVTIEYDSFPVGSPNIQREQGGIIPTTAGFDPKYVQPFNTLLSEQPSYIFSSVLASSYMDVYGIFPCRIGEEETNVLMMNAKSGLDMNGNVDRKTMETFKAWEPYVFSDIGHFIFPSRTVPDSPGLVAFRNVGSDGYKSGQVTFSGGVEGYIYTGWRLNFSFYASSLECLENAMDLVYTYD